MIIASQFLTNIVHDETVLSNRELEAILLRYGVKRSIFNHALLFDHELLNQIFEICNFTYNNKPNEK